MKFQTIKLISRGGISADRHVARWWFDFQTVQILSEHATSAATTH